MTLESWGRWPRVKQDSIQIDDLKNIPWAKNKGYVLPRGNGRSYGDSCLSPGGTLLVTTRLNHFISFDRETGRLTCEAGVLLKDILDLVVPHGWFLAVTPGTQYVTVGGAIANDVHGKNHHNTGSFGNHVLSFNLIRSDGQEYLCQPGNPWFAATVGGLGLTGIITWAEIQLIKIQSPALITETFRFRNIDGFFELSDRMDKRSTYSVSWIDCVASGRKLGRGIFTLADHANIEAVENNSKTLSMPITPPFSLVNKWTLKAFNEIHYNAVDDINIDIQHYKPFFYPLDSILNWNRLYGPNGFLQYQCVLPNEAARHGIIDILKAISDSGTGSPLAVLKRFGDHPSAGLLSFARPGITLALDFPRTTSAMALLDRLDAIVRDLNGAVYPAKDSRMSAQSFRHFFKSLDEFMSFRDPAIHSGFSRRMGI